MFVTNSLDDYKAVYDSPKLSLPFPPPSLSKRKTGKWNNLWGKKYMTGKDKGRHLSLLY